VCIARRTGGVCRGRLVRCAFSTGIYTRGCHWYPRLLLRLKLLHACDQGHSSRESTFLPAGTVNSIPTLTVNSTPTLTVNSIPTLNVNSIPTLKVRFRLGAQVYIFVEVVDGVGVRCAFSNKILHSRMPLDPTHVRLKLLHACDQWHSSRAYTALTVITIIYVETLKAVAFIRCGTDLAS
jgi:hypothetical protein